ncbi:MAG TPA: hypothetical protein VFE33_15085 [Thermoanaerobaculia bacterium]|nr:hypothetical protein [Thermoanaerobaculia bacterium]
MGTQLSIDQMLAELERQVAYHQERGEHHGQQEALHRERRVFHAAELQTAAERLEAFRAAAASAGELVDRHRAATAPPPPPKEPIRAGKRRPVGRLVAGAIASFSSEDTFDAADVARVVHQYHGANLRKRFDARAASVALRRLTATGRLHLVQKGTPHHLARYSRTRPAAPAGL